MCKTKTKHKEVVNKKHTIDYNINSFTTVEHYSILKYNTIYYNKIHNQCNIELCSKIEYNKTSDHEMNSCVI